MTNTNLYIFLLFTVVLILPLISLGYGHNYTSYCSIIMKKPSSGDIICVYEKTAEKLTQRGYVYFIHDWQRICDNNTNFTNSCNLVRNDDKLCIFVKSDPDICIKEYDKPLDHKECFNIFKLIVRHPVSVTSPYVDYFYTNQGEFDGFAFNYCDMESTHIQDTYDHDAIIYAITHHGIFVKNYGIPNSIVYDAERSMDENSSRNTYGIGYFLSPNLEKHNFKFTFHPIVFTFSLTD